MQSAKIRYVVIHLARAPERRVHMERELTQIGVRDKAEFFPAVDGQLLAMGKESEGYNPAEVRRQARWVPYVKHQGLLWSEAACFLSHRAVWSRLTQDKEHDFYVVLEDDAYLHPSFAVIMDSLVEGQDIDFVHLNTTQDAHASVPVQAKELRDLTAGHRLILGYGPYPQGKLFGKNAPSTHRIIGNWLGGTVGYVISRKGAEALLAHAPDIRRAVDNHMMRFWEHKLPPLIVNPHPARVDEEKYLSMIRSSSESSCKNKELFVAVPFYSVSPRNLVCRVVQIFLRRRDVLRYRHYIANLMEQFGAPDCEPAPPTPAPFSE